MDYLIYSGHFISLLIYAPIITFFKAIKKYKSICEIADPNDVNTQINEQKLFYFYHSLIESANVAIKDPDLNLDLNVVVGAVRLEEEEE